VTLVSQLYSILSIAENSLIDEDWLAKGEKARIVEGTAVKCGSRYSTLA